MGASRGKVSHDVVIDLLAVLIPTGKFRDIGEAERVLGKNLPVPLPLPW